MGKHFLKNILLQNKQSGSLKMLTIKLLMNYKSLINHYLDHD